MLKKVHSLLNEEQLFRELSEGNERAFEMIYRHYSARLFPFVDKMVRNRRITEEIIQDVFVQVWKKREIMAGVQFRSSYLFNIASNRTLDYQRKIASDKKLFAEVVATAVDFSNETEEQIIFNESSGIVKEAIASMPNQRRLIYELSRKEGLSHEQIASQLGISKSTVANQMVSALKHIRTFMERRAGVFSYAVFYFLTHK